MTKLPLIYDSCIETLKEASWDEDNDVYVSNSDLEVYNFDKVKVINGKLVGQQLFEVM